MSDLSLPSEPSYEASVSLKAENFVQPGIIFNIQDTTDDFDVIFFR